MRDDDNQSFDTFEPVDGDEPRPEFVDELLGRLEVTWHSRADGPHTNPSPDPIDIAVFEQGNEPMGKNRLLAILAAAAAAIVLVIVGLVVITDDDDSTGIDAANDPETTDPPVGDGDREGDGAETTAPPATTSPPTTTTDAPRDWSFDFTYIEVDAVGHVAATENFAWVVSSTEGRLSTIDLATNTVVSTSGLPAGSRNAWYAFGSVWVGGDATSSLSRVDPDSGGIVATFDLGGVPVWLDGGDESVWLSGDFGAVRIDPATNTIVARIPFGEPANGINATASGVWLRDRTGSLHRIDPATNTVVATVAAPGPGGSMTAGPDAVWVPGFVPAILYRIDPATGSVVDEIDVSTAVGSEVTLTAAHYAGDSIWARFCEVNCERQGMVRVDPETNEVVAIEDLPADWNRAGGISNGPGTIWNFTDDAIARVDY